MASDEKGKHIAQEGNMSSDYGQRAGLAINFLVPGPHRDKKIAGIFGVSVRLAKYLRAGRCWTVERLNQASQRISDFDAYLASPDFGSRIDTLERQLAELRDDIRRTGGNGK